VSDLLVGALSVLLATNQPAAASNYLAQRLGVPLAVPAGDAGDPLGPELRAVIALDDAADDEIERWAKAWAQLDPTHPATPSPTARQEQVRVKLDEIRAAYEAFVRAHPDHVKGRLAYASFLEELGDEEGAIRQLERARDLDPADPAVWNNLANHYGHVGPVAQAFPAYEKAIALAPYEAVYHYNLATTVFLFRKDAAEYYRTDEQGVFEKALGLYRQVRALRPFNFQYAFDYAQTYYGVKPAPADTADGRRASELRLAERALGAWDEALALADNEVDREGIFLHQARWHLRAGRPAAARTNLALVTNAVHAAVRERIERNLLGGGTAESK
jgi:uncharacterized protein (TIGR02996 family)